MNNFLQTELAANILPLVIFIVAYLIGTIPFGVIVARIFKIKGFYKKPNRTLPADAQLIHLAAVGGLWPAGIIAFFLDALKGVIVVGLATTTGYHFLMLLVAVQPDLAGADPSIVTHWAAGFFVVLGHCFSPWLHFKGGKGVATAFGVIFMLSPLSALFGFLGFMLTFYDRRIVSLSSIAGLLLSVVIYLVFNPPGIHLWIGAAMLFIVLARHEANIDALLENREPPFRFIRP